MIGSDGYFRATRHPWSALLFILPLLAIYEAALFLLEQNQTGTLRNGADTWLRWALANLGMAGLLWAPIFLLVILFAWSHWRRGDRPDDWLGVWIGMVFESALFAFGLWSLSRGFCPFLENLGLAVASQPQTPIDPAVERVISYLGAGIYEETLFRLLLFSGLIWVFRLVEMPSLWVPPLAAVLSALAFAMAHNLGPHGETFDNFVFLFRTFAGIYFALLFHMRGFGIAVGAHTGYDVLVGILVVQ
jgi:hypothetical protein